jgi:hypothetical protein
MARFRRVIDVRTGAETQVPFTPKEEAAADAIANAPAQVPGAITARQGKIKLLRMGLMTAMEASAGAVPAFLVGVAAKLPDGEAAELMLTWHEATTWRRDHPLFGGSLLDAAAAALGQPATDEAVDQFFRDAASI